jgi:hypothetical protein
MTKKSVSIGRSELWTIATIAFVLMFDTVPFFAEKTDAQQSPTSVLLAPLFGLPIGGTTPQGIGSSAT